MNLPPQAGAAMRSGLFANPNFASAQSMPNGGSPAQMQMRPQQVESTMRSYAMAAGPQPAMDAMRQQATSQQTAAAMMGQRAFATQAETMQSLAANQLQQQYAMRAMQGMPPGPDGMPVPALRTLGAMMRGQS